MATYTPQSGFTYDPTAEVPNAPLGNPGQLARGLRSSLRSLAANEAALDYYKSAAAGDTAAAQQHGLRAQQYLADAGAVAPRVQSVGDIRGPGDAWDYMQGVMGAAVPQIAESAAGGALGSAAGALLATRLGFRPQALTGAAQGAVRGLGAAGAIAPIYGQFQGEGAQGRYQAQLNGAQPLAPDQALRDINQQAALQTLPYALAPMAQAPGRVVGKAMLPTAGATVGRNMALGAGADVASTLTGQAYRDVYDPTRDRSGDMMELADEVIGGAVVGAPFELVGQVGDKTHSGVRVGADAARRIAPPVGKAVLDGVVRGAQWVGEHAPGSVNEASEMVGKGAARVATGLDNATVAHKTRNDADLKALVGSQSGMDETAMRADDDVKHAALNSLMQRMQEDPSQFPQPVRDAIEQYSSGPRMMDSWRGVRTAVRDWQRASAFNQGLEHFMNEAALMGGKGAAQASNFAGNVKAVYTVERDAARKLNAQTPAMRATLEASRDEFSPILERALAPLTGFSDPSAQNMAARDGAYALRMWLSNGLRLSAGEVPSVPRGLLRMFSDPASAVEQAADLMHRQGLVGDDLMAALPAVRGQLGVLAESEKLAGVIIEDNILPTASEGMSAVDFDNLAQTLGYKLKHDTLGAEDQAYVRELFGPRAKLVLNALRKNAEDAQTQAALRSTDRERSNGGARTQVQSGEPENDGDMAGVEDWSGSDGIVNEGTPETTFHFYRKGSPEKIDAETGEVTAARADEPYKVGASGAYADGNTFDHDANARVLTEKLQSTNNAAVRKQGYLDYLRERYAGDSEGFSAALVDFITRKDREVKDLVIKHGGSAEDAVNKHWYVLREEASKQLQGEATNIDPSEFTNLSPRAQGNKWAERGDGIYGTVGHGRIWLERRNADGSTTPFATSAARVISRMAELRKVEGHTGGQPLHDLAGQRSLLLQGLASLLSSKHSDDVQLGDYGKRRSEGAWALTGRIGFKDDATGRVRWIESRSGDAPLDLPDNLRMLSTNGETYGDARRVAEEGRNAELVAESRTELQRLESSLKEINAEFSELRQWKVESFAGANEIDRAAWANDTNAARDTQRFLTTLVSQLRKALGANDIEALRGLQRERDANADAARIKAESEETSVEYVGMTREPGGARSVHQDGSGLRSSNDYASGGGELHPAKEVRADAAKATRTRDDAASKRFAKTDDLADVARVYSDRGIQALSPMHKAEISKAITALGGRFGEELGGVRFALQASASAAPATFYRKHGIIALRPDVFRSGDKVMGETVQRRVLRTVAHELAHARDFAAGYVSETFNALRPGGKAFAEIEAVMALSSKMEKWFGYAFDMFGSADPRAQRQGARELYAQLHALYAYDKEYMSAYLPKSYKAIERDHATTADKMEGAPSTAAHAGLGRAGRSDGADGAASAGGRAPRAGVAIKSDGLGTLPAADRARSDAQFKSRGGAEPASEQARGTFADTIQRHLEYLNNPPNDYSPNGAKSRQVWAEAQLERVKAEQLKLKGSQDYDLLDRLSDYKSDLQRLVNKAKEMLAADAELEAKMGPQGSPSLLSRDPVAPARPVGTTDAHEAIDAVTAAWHAKDAPAVELAPTFGSLPKEIQDSVQQKDQAKAKGIFHPGTNTIWLVLDRHGSRRDVEETLYHEGGHWGTLTELGKRPIEALHNAFDKIGVPQMAAVADEHGFKKEFTADLKDFLASKKKPEDRARLLAEVLANLAQKAPYRSWPSKLRDAFLAMIGAIRSAFKASGHVTLSQLNEADLLHLVAQGNKRLETGGRTAKGLPSFLTRLSQELHDALGRDGFAATHDSPARHEGKITTNAVSFNEQGPMPAGEQPPTLTPDERAQFFADVTRRLGPDMQSVIEESGLFVKNAKGEDVPISGEWVKGLIKASVYARNIHQVGAHEAFHEFFSRLTGAVRGSIVAESAEVGYGSRKILDILTDAAGSAPVLRQLQRLLHEDPAALKQIDAKTPGHIEERMAYMFQFHQAGLLKIGPETEGVFTKMANMFRRFVGILTNDQKADAILRAFDQGKMQTADAAAKVLAEHIEGREKMFKAVNAALFPAIDRVSRLVNTSETNLRRAGPKYDEIRKMFKLSVGEKGEPGMFNDVDRNTKRWLSKWAQAVEGLEPKDLELAAQYLHSGRASKDPAVRSVQRALWGADGKSGLMGEMHAYLTRSGVQRWVADASHEGGGYWEPIGRINERYFPRVYDTAKLVESNDEAVKDMVRLNGGELNAIASELSSLQEDGSPDVTAEDIAQSIITRLTRSMGHEGPSESTSSIGYTPWMRAVNKRSLHWIHPDFLAKYGEKDVNHIVTSYVAQSVKRAEYVRRFGNDGEILKAKLEEAQRANVSRFYNDDRMSEDDAQTKSLKVAEKAARDIMALEGTLGHDISPTLRRVNNSLMVYENMRTLAMSIFSQMIDPMNLVINGAEFKDAWYAYKRGLKEVLASYKGKHEMDADAKIAAEIGTLDAAAGLANFGQTYSSQYMGGNFRKWNDALFKYNGMEGFNRGMQIAGTRAAIGAIKRTLVKAAAGDSMAVDRAKELGLWGDKRVELTKDGELDITDTRVQQAVHTWVSGAVMRPNAAQRPAWASDPRFMLFWHMKQFAYTFHDLILKRALYQHQKFGDMGPAGVLGATLVPIMIASDAAKSLLLTGNEPGWMHGGLDSEIAHGVNRAGLAGKFQPFIDAADPNRSVLGLGGPLLEQLAEMGSQAPSDAALNALPGASVINTVRGRQGAQLETVEAE